MSIWKKKSAVAEKPPEKKQATVISMGPTMVGGMPASVPASNTDYAAHLEKEIRNANQEGLDYLEFSGAIKMLDGQALTEQQKYVVTFPSYSASGVTPDKLVESANKYLEVLNREKGEFDIQVQRERRTAVTDKLAINKSLEEEVAKLTAAIQEKTKEMARLATEANEADMKLKSEEMAFANALNLKQEEIQNNIGKIKIYLNATTIQ